MTQERCPRACAGSTARSRSWTSRATSRRRRRTRSARPTRRAAEGGTRAVILNFTGLEYMNSGGIGLLVTLLVRANRAKQKLLAFGLTEHYRQIFELTRLDEAIGIYDTEAEAVAAAA